MRLETRHWIFAGLFLLIGLTLVSGIMLDLPVSPDTQRMYDFIEQTQVIRITKDHRTQLPAVDPTFVIQDCFTESNYHFLFYGEIILQQLMDCQVSVNDISAKLLKHLRNSVLSTCNAAC